ncbi:MAG: carbon-nitrogen hydrolase [Actinomycetia bacterium]|nr:carbon-nitrogen hydrolase [Actinomycetes bacterium]
MSTQRRTVRVAAAQCEIGPDVGANIETLVRMVGAAAEREADLVVLPEFGNHLSVYESADHAWQVAIDVADPDDAFVTALAAAAAAGDMWVVANATVRRSPAEGGTPPRMTITQMLFSPTDGLVAQADKHVLMGAERTYLSGGDSVSPVIDTPLGRIGMYCCMDGVVNETARALAVDGAEILCNSLNSFALDEASLHVPVRAAENGVWIVACCKVGPLLPEHRLAEFSGALDVPPETFTGAGESQVVAPDGTVLVMAPADGEAIITADIEVASAGERRRPDGTNLLGLRRPDLYGPVAQPVEPLPATGADTVEVAALQDHCGDIEALADAVKRLASDGAELIVLPELASEAAGIVGDPAAAALAGRALVESITAALSGTGSHVVTSVVEGDHRDGAAGPGTGEPAYAHVGLVLSADGVEVHQPALHVPERHRSWQEVLGGRVKVLAAAFGRLSVLVGDDALVPEAGRLAVLGGSELLAVPFSAAEATDLKLVLPERSAENRVCLVAASRHGAHGGAGAFDPPENAVWSRPDRPAPFDRTINEPVRHLAGAQDTDLRATLHPARAAEKLITTDTDLVFGRRPELRGPLVKDAR